MSSTPEWIERLLAADPRDVGCDEVRAVMHVYVDLRAAGIDPGERYAGVASHLDSCGACAESVRGLITCSGS